MNSTTINGVRPDHRTTVQLDPRNNGPRRSSNGGFAAGNFAAFVGGTAEVRLMARPPLGTPLTVETDGGFATVHYGSRAIATAKRVSPFVLEPPIVPSMGVAEAARRRHPGNDRRHALSDCVVCGPRRRDGMHVTPGQLTLADRDDVLVARSSRRSGTRSTASSAPRRCGVRSTARAIPAG